MENLIIYYSRTGKSKVVAEKLQNIKQGDLYELSDKINFKGIFGFIKGGLYSIRDKEIEYVIDAIEYDKYKNIYIVSPIWAGKTQPTVRTFIKNERLKNAKLILLHGMKEADEKIISQSKGITDSEPIYISDRDVLKEITVKKLSSL